MSLLPQTLDLAARNVLRNRRRSLTTVVAVAVGALSVVLFGGYVANIFASQETAFVKQLGHLQVTRTGYQLFGSGDPVSYGIADYQAVMDKIAADPAIAGAIRVMTPRLQLFGIAGNFEAGVSKTFFGLGIVPSERERMLAWDPYDTRANVRSLGLTDDKPEEVVVGSGMARMLLLCAPLSIPNCPAPPVKEAPAAVTAEGAQLADLAQLAAAPSAATAANDTPLAPRIDLLAATARGAPNAVNVVVAGARNQGIRALDESYVAMALSTAQRLVYGRAPPKVTAIVLQLNRTEDITAVRAGLNRLFKEDGLDLEVVDFTQIEPFYLQVKGMFSVIFGFIAGLMGLIVLFTVVNTMSMAVVERTAEIGTLRALGMRRSRVRRLFVAEGLVLGVIGASLGLALGLALAALVNGSGLTWLPPNSVDPVPLLVRAIGSPQLLVFTWLGLVLVATLSALAPANRAANLEVVEALRHS